MRFCLTLLMVFAWTCGSVCPAQPLSISELESDHLAVEGLLSDPPEECDAFSQERELSRFKKQALQSLSITGGFASDVSGNGLSSSYVDLSIGTGVPLGSLDNILGVKPRVRVDWIDADPSLDVPRELYDFELLFFYRRPIRERLSAMAVVSPSIRSDLTTSDDAFRVFALGLLNWECIPERLTLSGGAVYLGRADITALPAIGLSWTPSRMSRLDLSFPVSKLSRRLAKDGGRSETWAYLSAGLGGNTWSITRDSMATDQLSLREFNLKLGIERLVDGGGFCFADAGYAFGRKLQYENDDSEVSLDDAILFRCGWSY